MGMKSVRLDDALERRLRQVVSLLGRPASSVIRDAIAAYCERALGSRLDQRLSDVIGVVESEGGRAERTGDAFRSLLREREDSAP
jgi:predicted transcriptional regulator